MRHSSQPARSTKPLPTPARLRWRRAPMLALALCGASAHAGSGIAAPSAEQLWPQWQVRINLHAAQPTLASLLRQAEAATEPRGFAGASLVGEVRFNADSLRNLRASGGLRVEAPAPVPLGMASDHYSALPYLGLGYQGSGGVKGLQLSADLGLVAARPEAALGVGRALLGQQGFDGALREMRLAPVLQLGIRYAF